MSARPGERPDATQLVNVPRLVAAYYAERPEPEVRAERVSFGTSGHRGSSLRRSFNEAHVLAMAQAVCDYRRTQRIGGPLFLGMDTHALAEPAFVSTLEVLAANGVDTGVDPDRGFTPTPVVSHAILTHNRGRSDGLADGVVITPSHNPPEDGGFKYNPPHGGPAGTETTRWIEERANALIAGGLRGVERIPWSRAWASSSTRHHDYRAGYVEDLDSVIDFDVLRGATPRLGVDALGGAGLGYWGAISDRYKLQLTLMNTAFDPTFRFMTLDWDGRIRMDCSSPDAMRGLIELKDRFDAAWACDTDHDRHGIVTRSSGLMNPNHYLAVAIDQLFATRPGWPPHAAVGKTLVSSSLIDRVAARRGRRLVEVPVGFKWFVDGLGAGSLGFAGEESAGGSFLRRDGTVWTTDKDGIIFGLLAAEMTARTGHDPGALYRRLTSELGETHYARIDAPATPAQKAVLAALQPGDFAGAELAGEPIESVLARAPGNDAPLGGVKAFLESGWFAARPSGTEDVYKIYAESYRGPEHLARIQAGARELIAQAFARKA